MTEKSLYGSLVCRGGTSSFQIPSRGEQNFMISTLEGGGGGGGEGGRMFLSTFISNFGSGLPLVFLKDTYFHLFLAQKKLKLNEQIFPNSDKDNPEKIMPKFLFH